MKPALLMACLLSAAPILSTPGVALAQQRPANGSLCNSNWVNNGSAMQCFIDGQSDIRNGVKSPRYVACSQAGEVFCCVDTERGQDCEHMAESGGRPDGPNWRDAVLGAHRATLTTLGRWDAGPSPRQSAIPPKAPKTREP